MTEVVASRDQDRFRDEWIARLRELVEDVEALAKADGWAVRRLDKKMRDTEIGAYEAPALIFQKEFTRLLLDPIGRDTASSDGVVDLYEMPALDDVAVLYSSEGRWYIRSRPAGRNGVAARPPDEEVQLTGESFGLIVNSLTNHGR